MTTFWHPDVAKWVAKRIPGCERGWDKCQAMGVLGQLDGRERVIAGIVFHDWNPEAQTIEISAAAETPRWFTRNVINEALGYAFIGAGCQMVVVRQAVDNTAARKIWLKLGGTEYIIPRLRGRDEAGSIITLTDDQWAQSKFKR